MKKFLIIALSAVFVLGLAGIAFAADVEFGGDARVRGIYKSNYDFDDTNDNYGAEVRHYDQRIRLKVHVIAGDGVEVRTRIVLSDGRWDGADDTGRSGMDIDYAYLHVPIGDYIVDAGRQKANWGNKFFVWEALKDRLKVTTKVNDTVYGGFIDKEYEANNPDFDGDEDGYGALLVHNFGDVKAGILLIYSDDDDSNETGTKGSIFANGTVNGLGVAAEIAYKTGDINEDSFGNSPWGAFVQVSKEMDDAFTVAGAIAYATNGYVANKYFTPTLFFGTSQPTAIMDFKAVDDASSIAIVGVVNYKATDVVTVIGRAAYASLEKMGVGGTDASVLELDACLKYAITKNTAYTVDLGVLFPNDMHAEDDAAVALVHKLEVKF